MKPVETTSLREWVQHKPECAKRRHVGEWAIPVDCTCGLSAALLASDSSAPEGWQAIESAPKDGTPVLLLSSTKSHTMQFVGYWYEGKGEWWFLLRPLSIALQDPTHWHVLPSPPTEPAQETR